MGPTKIMIIRHAEKPGIYNKVLYNGINPVGKQDPDSLITMGWERAGGVASLFYGLPSANATTQGMLATPDYIYASNPLPPSSISYKTEPNGNMVEGETSQRPYQTISALSSKMQISTKNLITSFVADDYYDMVTDVLSKPGVVLIAWQHQDILPQPELNINDSILTEFLGQTLTPTMTNTPSGPWPPTRYDMAFVLDRPLGKGPFTAFTQVPQMLLAGDSSTLFPL